MNGSRTRNIELPDHWTPEQALSAFQITDLIRDAVWLLYRDDIQQAMRKDQQSRIPCQRPTPPDPDNPF